MIRYLLFWCLAFAGHASDVMTMDVNAKSPHFRVVLPANLTTGYQWKVQTYDKTLFLLKDSAYVASKAKRMGSGGKMIFTFVLQPGQSYPAKTEMIFKYVRPWAPEKDAKIQKVTISFHKKAAQSDSSTRLKGK